MKKRLLAMFLAVVMAVSLLSVMAFADGEDTTVSEAPTASEEPTETETPDETEEPAETEEPVESEEPADPDETEDSDETEEPETTEGTFSDVDEDDWFYDEVMWAAEKGYIKGNDGKFSPNNELTRGEIWLMLARIDGVDTTPGEGEVWYQKGLDWAVENEISDGTRYGDSVRKDELAIMLCRFVGGSGADASVLNDYLDSADVAEWAVEGMAWAVENGIITGDGSGNLAPQGNTQRSVAAVMLQRYCVNVLEATADQ